MSRGASRVIRPPARLILTTPEHCLAFAGGAGLFPWAPGTMGTLVAVPIWWLISALPWPLYVVLVAGAFVLGCWACGRSARLLGAPDYSGIVFDEVVGYWISAFPLLPSLGIVHWPEWVGMIAAFVLFRLFDIWKPGPVRWLDGHVHGGTGIMLDDVAAGVLAAVVLALALLLT